MAQTGIHRHIADGIAGLLPAYFALVMATAAVSIACSLLGFQTLSISLLIVNIVAYVMLVAITGIRLLLYTSRVVADMSDHVRGPGFFTHVAGTCILGTQLVIVADVRAAAEWLLLAGVTLWLVIMYSFFTAVIVRREKPDIRTGINGAWLIATVATQSVSVLAVVLQRPFGIQSDVVAFGALVFFLIGCMLYLAISTLIFYRLTFLEVDSAALTPPYWINMGAVAITTLAGTTLILRMSGEPVVVSLLPFLKGFTLFFWSAATWWIPVLFALGFWRHVWKRFPLKYDPQYWGMVFPLGMYTIATWRLSEVFGAEFLKVVPRVFVVLAFAAWVVTVAGMLYSWIKSLRSAG